MAGETPWTVTLEDRSIATDYWHENGMLGDFQALAQAFARHRHESQVELVEALREARTYIEDAANDCRDVPNPADHLLDKIDNLLSKIGDAS